MKPILPNQNDPFASPYGGADPFAQPNWNRMYQPIQSYMQPPPMAPVPQPQQGGSWWDRLMQRQMPNSLAANIARFFNPNFITDAEVRAGLSQAGGYATDDWSTAPAQYGGRNAMVGNRTPRTTQGMFPPLGTKVPVRGLRDYRAGTYGNPQLGYKRYVPGVS